MFKTQRSRTLLISTPLGAGFIVAWLCLFCINAEFVLAMTSIPAACFLAIAASNWVNRGTDE